MSTEINRCIEFPSSICSFVPRKIPVQIRATPQREPEELDAKVDHVNLANRLPEPINTCQFESLAVVNGCESLLHGMSCLEIVERRTGLDSQVITLITVQPTNQINSVARTERRESLAVCFALTSLALTFYMQR